MCKKDFEEYRNQKFMRADQLAQHLGVGKSTIWYWCKQERITSKKISERVTVFEVAEVEKALFGGAK